MSQRQRFNRIFWKPRIRLFIIAITGATGLMTVKYAQAESVARMWNEQLLQAIRNDFARPTVHARNLYHTSLAMYDAWAAYDNKAATFITNERPFTFFVQPAREEAISYAAFRILKARFASSPGAAETLPALDALMVDLGYDPTFEGTVGDSPRAFGNRIAAQVLAFGFTDGSNEFLDYGNLVYQPVNPPILPDFPGNPDMVDFNRWQPIALEFAIDQSGNIIPGGTPPFLSPEWGIVTPFALTDEALTIYQRDNFDWWVYHDPGAPPLLGGAGDDYFKWGFEMVAIWSSHLDANDPTEIDISPASLGNTGLPDPDDYEQYYDFFNGGDASMGHALNPATGQPYPPNMVRLGDYARILAEFWADGPDSETPPGHWFTIANTVFDHPQFERRFMGQGPLLSELEWDVKAYLALGGAMHDSAISAWGIKGWYDYLRPVSAIRYMADQGQSSHPDEPSYNPNGLGISLHPGFIEVVTAETTAPMGHHEHLAGNEGKIALKAWRGPDFIENPDSDVAGVGWILAENWWPYQRPTFVSPPFAGYVSGHSTYSRAAAELLTLLTGDEFFPGGVGEFVCPVNEFLVFEDGPSETITLQWATYRDASDQTSLSRIWGGIHPPCDDLPGRVIGAKIGPAAFSKAFQAFEGIELLGDVNCDDALTVADANTIVDVLLGTDTTQCHIAAADVDTNGFRDSRDIRKLVELLLQ